MPCPTHSIFIPARTTGLYYSFSSSHRFRVKRRAETFFPLLIIEPPDRKVFSSDFYYHMCSHIIIIIITIVNIVCSAVKKIKQGRGFWHEKRLVNAFTIKQRTDCGRQRYDMVEKRLSQSRISKRESQICKRS